MDLPGWQALREELHPLGVEVVTVGLEMGGGEILRPYIDDANPKHPSLIDQSHEMDALFGVTNIPSAVWIDEQGTIVRPPEPCSPPPVTRPDPQSSLQAQRLTELAGALPRFVTDGIRARSQYPQRYANRLRDWAQFGAQSHYALAADEVIARSRPRPIEVSRAAAHFELAQHLWRVEGFSARTLNHFEAAHTLQPDNITYKRQAYSAYSFGRSDGNESSRLLQSPVKGEEWPFVSDYNADMVALKAQLERERDARQQPSA